jgi:hypothetical protein
MTTNKKFGFGGQWVDGTPVGKHVDSDGDEVSIDVAFLEAVVANFEKTKNLHQPPAVIGHPKSNAPAYGYIAALRVNNGRLERQFTDVNPQFEEIVKSGSYKKRSDAFYLDPKTAPGGLVPALRHVGFLGAQPPAIKGIADIQFSEEGKTVDVEVDTAINFSEGDNMNEADVKKTVTESIKEFFKTHFGGSEKPAANFSETDLQSMIESAVKKVETTFSEEIASLKTENQTLQTAISSQSGSSTHAANIEFCEKRPDRIPPQLKDRYASLMDQLAGVTDKKVVAIEFAEDGKTEKKVDRSLVDELKALIDMQPPFVTFGEQYQRLQPTADPSKLEDAAQKQTMRAEMGLKSTDAGAK